MGRILAAILDNPVFPRIFARVLPYRVPLVVVVHAGFFTAAFIMAYDLRFEGLIPQVYHRTMWRTLPLVLLVQGGFFYFYNLYEGMWRYVSFADLLNIMRAVLMSLLVILPLEMLIAPYVGVTPRSVYVLNSLLVVAVTAGSRFLVRLLREQSHTRRECSFTRRIMVVGPVAAAEPLLREIYSHGSEYRPVALLDPDREARNSRVYDLPVIGGLGLMAQIAQERRVQEIIFAWPEAPEDRLSAIVDECKRFQIRFRIVPPLSEVLEGRYRLTDVRDVELEDLLPRPAIYIDHDHIRGVLQDRVVLVTGGGGSIGAELCRQVAGFRPRRLIILERAENSLFELEADLRRRFPDLNLDCQVASINDGPGLHLAMARGRPEVVFHAAAYKHVPLMERCPIEAAYNNILGTRNLVQAALAAGVECFVMISTDKAVNPSSIMGVSKRIAEKYVQASNNGSRIRFITTRFGNVLGSAGSVIPHFKRQIMQGGPVTVTHPEMERFFMTIPEAVQLVLQATGMGRGGDIFVLSMGRAVKIRELAEKLIVLAGKVPERDIEIVYTGLRPGEKMFEELFNADETPQPTAHALVQRAVGPVESCRRWEAHLDAIGEMVRSRDEAALRTLLRRLVPTYRPPGAEGPEP